MVLIRYCMIFTLPIGLALLLHFSTLQYRADAYQEATEWINSVLRWDNEAQGNPFDSLATGQRFQTGHWLDWVCAGTVIVGVAISAMLIPQNASVNRKANLLTTMVCGFCFAKLTVGFCGMRWTEFGIWMVAGLSVAVIIASIRNNSNTR